MSIIDLTQLPETVEILTSSDSDCEIINDIESLERVPTLPPKLIDTRHDIIVSVDIGRVNGAYCVYNTISKTIIDLKKWEISGTFSAVTAATQVTSLINNILEEIGPRSYMFIIEKQLLFKSPMQQYTSTINVSLEAAWHAVLLSKGLEALSTDPKQVKKMFEMPAGSDKKKYSVKMVNQLIQSDDIICTDEVKFTFQSTPKKDDLADAIIQLIHHINSNQ